MKIGNEDDLHAVDPASEVSIDVMMMPAQRTVDEPRVDRRAKRERPGAVASRKRCVAVRTLAVLS
jgi:hypothetical protein